MRSRQTRTCGGVKLRSRLHGGDGTVLLLNELPHFGWATLRRFPVEIWEGACVDELIRSYLQDARRMQPGRAARVPNRLLPLMALNTPTIDGTWIIYVGLQYANYMRYRGG